MFNIYNESYENHLPENTWWTVVYSQTCSILMESSVSSPLLYFAVLLIWFSRQLYILCDFFTLNSGTSLISFLTFILRWPFRRQRAYLSRKRENEKRRNERQKERVGRKRENIIRLISMYPFHNEYTSKNLVAGGDGLGESHPVCKWQIPTCTIHKQNLTQWQIYCVYSFFDKNIFLGYAWNWK